MQRVDTDDRVKDANVHTDAEDYAFISQPLRHHFHVGSENDNQEEHQAVERARQTRSAQLVAKLLYGGDTTTDDTPSSVTVAPRKTKKTQPAAKPKSPVKQAQSSNTATTAAAVVSIAAPSHPLYSLAVEQAIAKRMAFTRAVTHLDAYFDELNATIARLERKSSTASSSAAWLYDTKIKLPTMLQLQRKIVQCVASCLPDCDVYMAMFEPLPMANPIAATPWPQLRFVAASPHSRMAGHVLTRMPLAPDVEQEDASAMVSFAVLDTLDPELVPDISSDSRIQLIRTESSTSSTTSIRAGPFACLPLVDACDSHGIGVLALDSCRKAAQLLPEAMSPQALFEFLSRMQLPDAALEFRKLRFGGRELLQLTANDLQHRPAFRPLKIQTRQRILELVAALRSGRPLHLPISEPPSFFCDDDQALEFLDDVCERAGKFLDEYRRRVFWHRVMANCTRDAKTSVLDVYSVLVHGIADALVGVERVSIWKIRNCEEIQAIATTQIPDDRLLPFLQWNERQIRRLALYTEDNADHGQLIQGGITRIHLLPLSGNQATLQSPTVPSQPCERASYHVTWSNRVQQSLSWPQLRQLLPIRPMNARHYQLSQLIKKLQQLQADDASNESGDHSLSGIQFRLVDPSALVVLLHDPPRPSDVVYALQVDLADQNPSKGDGVPLDLATRDENVDRFIHRAAAITQQNLVCVRARETRSFRRQSSTVKTMRSFNSIGLTPSADALRALDEIVAFVFDEIRSNLPGTQQQIAELQSDGAQLRFTFAANGSTLSGKTLTRPHGVSFRCIDTRTPVVVTWDSELRHRLKWIGSAAQDMEMELPYVFLPLVHEDACIGVLSVNRFASVPKGRADEVQPEDGVIEYLSALAKVLAAAIYLKRRAFALYELQQLQLEPLRSPEQLLLAACKILHETMVGCWKTRVAEVDFERGKCTSVFDYSEAARVQAETESAMRVVPLSFRVDELYSDTVQRHWQITEREVDKLLRLCEEREKEEAAMAEVATSQRVATTGAASTSAMEVQQRKHWEWRVRQRYYRIHLKPLEDYKEEQAPSKSKSASKQGGGAQLMGARSANEKYVVHALSTSLSSKTIAYADVPALAIGSSSAVYVIVATLQQYYATCEQHFVGRVAAILSRMLDALVQRIDRSRCRVDSLAIVRAECASFVSAATASIQKSPAKPSGFPMSPTEELRVEASMELLDRVVHLISGVLLCPSVYIALHEPFHRRLAYVAASETSGMKGKRLHRGHGVSFHALDTQQPVVVTATTATADHVAQHYGHAAAVRYFSNGSGHDSQKWPFIVVPIGRVGILALDNLHKYETLAGETQPEIGVVDFLRRAGTLLGEAIASVRAQASLLRQKRRDDALVRVMAACDDHGKSASAVYIQHVALQAIESALNGVDAYIGLLQPLCVSILFTSATSRSAMTNQHVNAVDSVSFRAFLSQRPLVIPQVERKQFDNDENHVAQLVHQLRWFTPPAAAAQADNNRRGPFVCIPIPFVGVLSVDSFPGAASGIYSSHTPEYGVVDWLNQIANLVGASIRQLNAGEAIRTIATLFEGNRSSYRVLLPEILRLVASNVVTAVELCVLCYDAQDSWRPVCGADAPLAALTTSVSEYNSDSCSVVASLEAEILQAVQTSANQHDPRCFMLQTHPEVIVVRCVDTRDVDKQDGNVRSTEWLDACPQRTTILVVRRVRGATWEYDVEFLQSLLPQVDELFERVNVRACGLAARRNALLRLEEWSAELENHTSASAAHDALAGFVDRALSLVTQAASLEAGDAYMAERAIGGAVLRYVAASPSSLMRGVEIDLLAAENQNMVVVQSLFEQQKRVIHVKESSCSKASDTPLLRPLTAKKHERVFIVVPMGESRVLCVDSLSADAFDAAHGRLEKDVEAFVVACATLLETTITTVQYRRSYDQLCCMKTLRHTNFRALFASIHEILRRDLGILHSQQIVELAGDFTGQFTVRSWHRAATRRLIRGDAFPSHFCFTNGCERDWIAKQVHHEQRVALPMTNLPRTLDQSRATMEPVVGREKQGAYACDCLAVMLDGGLKTAAPPRLALCVYSHDERGDEQPVSRNTAHAMIRSKASRQNGLPTAFTARQRQYFLAFGAVVADVYVDVFRACVLETFSTEALFIARDRLGAKDAVLFTVDSHATSDGDTDVVCVVTGSSSPMTKWVPGSHITGKLKEKVLRFHLEPDGTEFMILQTTKKPVAPRNIVSATATPIVPPAVVVNTQHHAAGSTPSDPPASTGKSFFKRPRLFGAKQTQPKAASQGATSPTAKKSAVPVAPKATVDFHILLRGHHKGEVLSIHVERECDGSQSDASDQLAADLHAMVGDMAAIKSAFVANPQGDEEWNGAGFGHVPEIGEGTDFGGGGFHVLANWSLWRARIQSEIVHFETDMRSYLTGVQATSREQLGAGVASAVRPGLLASNAAQTTQESMFAHENTAVRAAAMILVRATLLLCGYKKETVLDASEDKDDDLLKEYLRANAGRKLMELNPRVASKWAAALRAGSFIKSKFAVVAPVAVHFGSASPHKHTSTQGATALLFFILGLNSAVKYFKCLQDNARQRKQRVDATTTVIQCFYRCVRAKATFKQLRLEFKAALAIQCAFRQYLARRRRLFLKWNRAALTVQRAYRRKLAQRRGRRPRKLTLELRTVAAQYGTLGSAASNTTFVDGADSTWKTDMGSFDSFKSYLGSRVGREQLKREEQMIAERLKEVVRQRERLEPHERLLADAHDVFELLDVDGSGELSRELTRELMTRLHVPLSREEADDVIDMMDNDHSGAISFAEFTNWFAHEFAVLKKRSRDCGVLLKRDRQWMAEESARSALRKRWRAHRQRGNDADSAPDGNVVPEVSVPVPPVPAEAPSSISGSHEPGEQG